MRLIVNSKAVELHQPTTVAELLVQLQLPLRGIAVELNSQIVPQAMHAAQMLADGDQLEIVSLVGGG